MSLDRTNLQKVRELARGGVQAQFPSCAETGNDRKGDHLRISPDGKFGCCVFPGDREHRKRIFALAGNHSPTEIKLRVASATAATVQTGILGRLSKPVEPVNRSDGSDGAKEVKSEKSRVKSAE